jgi:hypothetical protein
MKGILIAGIALVLLGIAALVVNVVPIRHQEQVAKIGPVTINSQKETDYVIPNYVGIGAIVVGVVLVVVGTRRA